MADLFPVFEIDEDPEDLADLVSEEISYGRSVYFDWRTRDFALTGGQMRAREAQAAWLDWCVKTVRTQRYAFLVYSEDYGVDFDGITSTPGGREIVETEIEDEITEALLIDPRTARVYGFEFAWQGDELEISFMAEPTIGAAERVEIRHVGLV